MTRVPVESCLDQGALRGRFLLGSRRAEVDCAQGRVLEAMEHLGYDPCCRFAVRAALEEALINAIEHGNGNDPAKTVTVEYVASRSSIIIEVEDHGEGFDPEAVPDPTRRQNMDIPSGRGILLMRAFMSDVDFYPPGNRVRMAFRRE